MGKPIFRTSSSRSVSVSTRCTYSGQCVNSSSLSTSTFGDSRSVILFTNAASRRRASRVRAYLSIGKRCPSGRSTRAQSAKNTESGLGGDARVDGDAEAAVDTARCRLAASA